MKKEELLPLTFYVPQRIIDAVQKAADEEYLSRTAFIRRVVVAAVKGRDTVAA
jgi:hypothetical protein